VLSYTEHGKKELAMITPTHEVERPITLTTTPTLHDLRHWWETRQADPDSAFAFTDAAPRNFAELLDCIYSGKYLFYLAHRGYAVVGAMWLHDMVNGPDNTPRAGWLGTYVLPEHRGRHTTYTMWRLVHEALSARGARSVYIASHHGNIRAHAVAERHLGFHRVDTYPAFASCQGVPTDYVILSMRPEDMTEAWVLAHARAQRQSLSFPTPMPKSEDIDSLVHEQMVHA
jgi:RimJ/RimL family protein N-acetyltransferase